MNCRLCENTIEEDDTAILGVCQRDIEKLVVGAVKARIRSAEETPKTEETPVEVPAEPVPVE